LLAIYSCPSRPIGSYAAYDYKYRCSHFLLPENQLLLPRTGMACGDRTTKNC
jgi:hypothetical protein